MRLVVFLNAESQQVHGALKILLLEDVSNANLVQTLAGGCVEALAGSKHNRVAVVIKVGEQPFLEGIRIVNGQCSHHVERTLRFLNNDAGDFEQLIVAGVAAEFVFLANSIEIVGINAVKRGGSDLIKGCNGKPCLTELHEVLLKLLVAGDNGSDTCAAGRETLGYGVDDNGVFVDIFELSDGCKLLAAVNEFTVNFVADNKQVVFFCDIRNGAQLFMSQNNAGGVARGW